MKKKVLVTLAIVGIAAAAAHAEVAFSVSFGTYHYTPRHCYTPAPVVCEPAPVVCNPAPLVYQPAPVVYQPAPVVYEPSPVVCAPAPRAYCAPRVVYVQPSCPPPVRYVAPCGSAPVVVYGGYGHGYGPGRGYAPSHYSPREYSGGSWRVAARW